MILDENLRSQLLPYMDLLENPIILKVDADDSENGQKINEFTDELASLSDLISKEKTNLNHKPAFSIEREGVSGLVFSGLPLGHELNSLVLALVQVSGRPPRIEQELIEQIKAIKTSLHFDTYVSLTCHNCPDVVQALNTMTILNPNISHTMIEGGMFQAEVEAKGIMAVPAVFKNGEEFHSGRASLEELLEKITGPESSDSFAEKEPYDVLVVGGGPAGASAAIYAARKGIRTGLIAERFGGQPLETLGIENLIGTPYIEGVQLGRQLEEHVKKYPVDLMNLQKAVKLEKKDLIEVSLANGATLKSKAVILSTGARWRDLGIPGEQRFKNKGVAYCPHCDGPLFSGKDVAVIGGGNSGIEAAIDLAGLVNHVTVLEFLPELKADKILQKKLASLTNVTVLTNVETKEILGDEQVTGLNYQVRGSKETIHLELAGVFVLIGLVPNTQWLEGTIDLTDRHEIVTDKVGATNIPGVFAAGDCTDTVYKQIIVSMGSGATASLGAFDYLIRN
ncbi:MAG: alkyl hydroperoxide reductase subunit F [Lactococcus cremoris]|uniref:NADH dehydrogenase n=4 Tax=Lactococcus lactis subsp. cremoris TaxID=1359 RepID=A0A1E7G6N5_LACLC|nr:alkyl hydroperoxide reductase subunit F [Lactococcus cremoris]MBS5601475.1 alkyl hydroperoxide reductase subunit F [Lactococcus lactis]ADJ59378.1 alkyl hydroperoxide reductase subunit F [Lactococcus cremoris subsp. cremoris NZ9000]AGV72324.1 alkyl hydroperoxide reductase F subunit AhpF [Lactococcus cremoris subsp. cremoris KW2]KEY62427.1 Alkyl hydroperoxide reductase, large subunit [Lactococcus cremoris subsp. cremoris GE214]KKW69651.1 alkyl hydroperoxide reductase subunit F, ahpF [Lactococ